jgi:hypothetical protein
MTVVIDGVQYVPMPEQQADKGLLAALDLRFDSDAGANLRVRDYLCKLLQTLWDEQDGFSGKRPFGNSDWCYDLYQPLIAAGFIPGTLYADGGVEEVDIGVADAYIHRLILAAFYGVQEGA